MINESFSSLNSKPTLLKKSYHKTLQNLSLINDNLSSGKLTFDYGGRPIRALPSDIVRVVSQMKTDSEEDLVYKNMLLNAVISLEIDSAFSSEQFINCLLNKSFHKDNLMLKLRSTEEDLLHLVRKKIGKGICYEIFKEILFRSSIFCDLKFKVSNTQTNFELEVTGGKKLNCQKPFLFNHKIEDVDDAYVIFVDGIIEKVSEIHNLLESSSSENCKVVIFSHGFSPDVVHTLSENFKNKKLKVIPMTVENKKDGYKDFESLQVFTVRRENYLSIRTVNIEDLSRVEKITFKKNMCFFLGNEFEFFSAKVTIPKHFANQSAVIEDRIRSALQYAQEISKYGVLTNEKGVVCGWHQYKMSGEKAKSFKNVIENIGCIVTHSR